MAESTNLGVDSSLPRWVVLAIALLSLPAFLLGLNVPFIGPDEPRYAEVGREMWRSGDLITPTLAGYHWFEKPPLLYWLETFFYSIFGVNEFAARLGPALCGLSIVACLWVLGRAVFEGNERQLTNWFVLVAASTLGLITFSHAASTDIVVTLPLAVAMTSFFVYDRRSGTDEVGWRLYRPLFLMYFAAGFALLAKGLIGIIFPPAIIILFYVLSRRWPHRRLMMSSLWGIPITLAIAAIWYMPMYVKYGDEFIREFIIRQHFERFTTNVFQHPQRFYFYLYVLPLMTLPWLPFFVAGLWRGVRQAINRQRREALSSLLIFCFSWLLVPLVFFSASNSKLPGYILPSIPPAIIIAAIGVYSLAKKSRSRMWICAGLAAATIITVAVLLVTAFPPRAARESVKPLLDVADSRGFGAANILLLHNENFSAEFYAGDRLSRDPNGKQVKLYGPSEVEQVIRSSGSTSELVLVPKEYLHQLLEYQDLTCEVLAENRDDCLVVVTLR
jgi:4-amino-4-deoxy-L-arabinose transferase-like glycosyltransferase